MDYGWLCGWRWGGHWHWVVHWGLRLDFMRRWWVQFARTCSSSKTSMPCLLPKLQTISAAAQGWGPRPRGVAPEHPQNLGPKHLFGLKLFWAERPHCRFMVWAITVLDEFFQKLRYLMGNIILVLYFSIWPNPTRPLCKLPEQLSPPKYHPFQPF